MDATKERMNHIGNSQDEIIELDVGDKYFKVRRKMLMKVPGSDLAAYFSGSHQQKLTDEGRVFLDRDAEMFNYTLSYLRNDLYIAPFGSEFLQKQFEAELKYWKLDIK